MNDDLKELANEFGLELVRRVSLHGGGTIQHKGSIQLQTKGNNIEGTGTLNLVECSDLIQDVRFSQVPGQHHSSITTSQSGGSVELGACMVEPKMRVIGKRAGKILVLTVLSLELPVVKVDFFGISFQVPQFLFRQNRVSIQMPIRDEEFVTVTILRTSKVEIKWQYSLRINIVSKLKEALKMCPATSGLLDQVALAGVPRVEISNKGNTNYQERIISLDGNRSWCALIGQFVQELSNFLRAEENTAIHLAAENGELTREEFIRRKERLEFEGGVSLRVKARQQCGDIWGCPEEPIPPWLESDFETYFKALKANNPQHLEAYGTQWDAATAR